MAVTEADRSTRGGARRRQRRTVPEQLAAILRSLRDEGLLFELAWEEALTRIVWPVSQRETREWELALEGTKDTWRARYCGWEVLPAEEAVAGLVEALRSRAPH